MTGRFQIIDHPVMIPGKCTICGSVGGDDRKFVDFGITVEYEGTIYFCTLCMQECVRMMGFIDPHEHIKIVHELAEMRGVNEGIEHELDNLRSLVDSLNLFGALRDNTGMGEPAGEATSEPTSSKPGKSAAADEPKSAKSSDVKRREDIPDLGIPAASGK